MGLEPLQQPAPLTQLQKLSLHSQHILDAWALFATGSNHVQYTYMCGQSPWGSTCAHFPELAPLGLDSGTRGYNLSCQDTVALPRPPRGEGLDESRVAKADIWLSLRARTAGDGIQGAGGCYDDVFYLFLQKQKIGAQLHVYLEEGTYHKRLFRGPNTNDMKK